MIANKKSSIILVLKILEEYTDENHFLTQKEILELINSCYGLELERKSIGSSLQLLEEIGYDINKSPRGGFALLSRTFDSTEAYYLIDALFSSKSIDAKSAKKISDNISKCFSKYQRKDFSYIYKSSNLNKTSNTEVLYTISVIHDAIKLGKRIGFQSTVYDKHGNKIYKKGGYQYVVSPYYLINNYGRYYLICNYNEEYRPIQVFRVDYMVNIVIKDEYDIKPLDSLVDLPKDFSITKFLNENIYLFTGDVVEATIKLDNEAAIACVKDWFGESVKTILKDDQILMKIKCNESALYYWVMQYSDCVTVLEPESFVNRVKEGLTKALDRYK